MRTSLVRVRDRLARRLLDSKTPVAAAALVVVVVAAVIATRGLLFGPAQPEDIDARRNPFPPTADSLAIGERVYHADCQTCHGADGRGDGPQAAGMFPRPVDFWAHFGSGHTHPDGRLFFWITEGMPGTGMPGFRDELTDAERWHVVNYIKTFAPVDR